jgi:hypothetical protein
MGPCKLQILGLETNVSRLCPKFIVSLWASLWRKAYAAQPALLSRADRS